MTFRVELDDGGVIYALSLDITAGDQIVIDGGATILPQSRVTGISLV